jgi:predicted restriction endonuclease
MTNKQNEFIRRKINELKELNGNKCKKKGCNEQYELQFAHIKPTELNGRGRGRKERYYDVIRNPTSYLLMCKDHHEMYDGGVIGLDEFDT